MSKESNDVDNDDTEEILHDGERLSMDDKKESVDSNSGNYPDGGKDKEEGMDEIGIYTRSC